MDLLFKGHGLSLSNHYWFKKENEKPSYDDINFFTKSANILKNLQNDYDGVIDFKDPKNENEKEKPKKKSTKKKTTKKVTKKKTVKKEKVKETEEEKEIEENNQEEEQE